ncbi:uncharacterized protein [Onthophagus taurus]|uniref:uncharacterized protein n=1 Tax=Onthophagus taurus TaxID=166361 RepID=UPI0039BDAAF3
MADLPKYRVSQLKPFSVAGVAFAGPFSVSLNKYRGAKTTKAYIAIFVCSATKALHLELVSDLSTEAFIAALRRFTSRRGRIEMIFSDQGTNFVGANNRLKDLAQLANMELGLNWSFNPPSSPHFNGLTEAGVKSVKTHLARVIGDQIMTYEELYTVLTQIEAVLNSRPLQAMSSDRNDFQSLTPGHFLVLEPLNSVVPDPALSGINIGRLTRWQLLQSMVQSFWKRWSGGYLHTLQRRYKWNKNLPAITPGTLVVIHHDSKPPLQWELGRVVDVHPGTDGVIRVATVRTVHSEYKRPVVKLCPLPLDENLCENVPAITCKK